VENRRARRPAGLSFQKQKRREVKSFAPFSLSRSGILVFDWFAFSTPGNARRSKRYMQTIPLPKIHRLV
jgi:hypothetical protein